jgi:ribosomal-protein-alanine N-acetyltransferase
MRPANRARGGIRIACHALTASLGALQPLAMAAHPRPPALVTARLLARPYSIEDVEEMHAVLLGDEQAMELVGGALDLHRARAAIELNIAIGKREGLGFGPVVERASGRIVGEAGLVPFGGHGPEVELGYAFASAYWGRGYATEIGGRLLEEAFGPLGLQRVVAVTKEENTGSRNVLRKLGFTAAGRRHAWNAEQLFFVRERDE